MHQRPSANHAPGTDTTLGHDSRPNPNERARADPNIPAEANTRGNMSVVADLIVVINATGCVQDTISANTTPGIDDDPCADDSPWTNNSIWRDHCPRVTRNDQVLAQHKIFQLPNQTGLTTAIIQPDINLELLLKPTSIENLWILTSGPTPPNPSELLGSEQMFNVVRELLLRADLVIFDSPPVLAVADAPILSASVDATLLVIDANKTKQHDAKRALDQLRQANSTVVGVALNRLDSRRNGYYYTYYYSSEGDEGGNNSSPGSKPKHKSSSNAKRPSLWDTTRGEGRSRS